VGRAAARVVLLTALAAIAAAIAATAPARAASLPWCGSGEPTADQPDAVNAFEWHVVYATASNGVDRFADYAPRIAGDVSTLSNWWLAQDSTRRPRFDLLAAPGCGTEYGRVDVSLAHTQPGDVSYDAIVADLRADGFTSPDKGYLVYFDGTPHAGTEYGVCGVGGTDRTSFAYSIVYLQTCGQETDDATRATVATHEMIHGMGAVSSQAPHACNDGHVCDSPADIMKAVMGPGDSLATLSLDVGHDDYYNHSGGWWDVRRSGLLYQLDQSLAPAPDVVGLNATGVGASARITWATSAPATGLVYRIYDEQGQLVADSQLRPLILETGSVGDVLVRTIRAENPLGFLSAPVTIRFKFGYGIVDASGTLLKDTVKPSRVTRVRATRAGSQVVLRWPAVSDPLGLRGYRVTAPGVRPVLVTGTTARLSLARVRGKLVSVAAVDRAGNVGAPASVRVHR
jgi:hypothetical protein